MAAHTYQGGEKEGEVVHWSAMNVMAAQLNYNKDDVRWTNKHDSLLEELSDILIEIGHFNR